MKKNSMRLLGFLLVAVMVVSLLGLGVFAGDTANDVNDAAGNVDAQSSEADLVINSVDDLLDFAESVNSGDTYSGEIVALGSDLDLTGLNWTPIGGWDGAVQFLGEFDGNGKTIFNLTINDTDVTAAKYRSGFFADLGQGSSVHDLTFDNVTVTNTKGGQVGALSGRSGADLETILVNGFEANVASGTYAGAVVGITNYYSSGDYGFSWDDVDAKGVTIAFKGSETSYGGGLLGGMNPNGARLNTYENCDVTDVTITDENIGLHGGMWGWHGRSGAFDYVKNCSVTNVNITTSGTGDSRVGGICGFVGVSGGLFENVTVNGGNLVAGGGYAGGFTPWSYAWGQDTYKNCSVENVNVTCETGMAGGFIAAAGAGNQTSKCIDCAVVGGTVTGRIASGFAASDRVGNAGGAYILNGCTSSAAVTGTEYAAGLIARASSSYQTVVTGSEFTGTVSGDGYVCEGVITTHTDKSLLDVSGVPVMYINIKDGEGNPTVETYRAAVNGKYYETLADAIDAANTVDGGATVTLLADVILGEKLTITGDVTIEGAYTITRGDAYTGTLFTVNAGATLTLDGGLTIDGGNAWTYTVFPPLMDMDNGAGTTVAEHITPAEGGVNATAHMIVNNGTLNVHSVTIENSYSTGGFSLINAGANSVTILDGATIRHTAANRSGAVANIGGIDAILTIKGTTRITDNFGVGNGGIIQNYGQGTTVNFEGGSIDNNFVGSSGTLYASYSGNADKINTFNMTGGIITKNVMEGYGPVYIHTNTVWNMSGGEISENVSYLPSYVRNNNPAGSMTGGKIANNEITCLDYNGGYYLTHPDLRLNGKTAITGGIYSQNVFEYLAPNTGLAYDDGLYTVVSKGLFKLHLTDPVTGEPAAIPYIEGNALASLVATGKLFYADYYEMTLEVLYDVKVDETVVIDYPMTIDLNGHTITGFSTMQSTPVFRVVSDVTVIGEGKVDGRPGSACYAFIVGQGENAGNLTIENGTFYGDTSAISVTKGTATINGGKFAVTPYQEEGKEDNYNFLLNCIDKNYKDGTAKIVVKGGTFYKFNPADNAAEGAGTSFVHENYLAEADGDYYTVRVNKDTLPTVADVVIKLEGGQTITLTYPSERFDTIQKLIGTNDYADFVLGAEQSELLAYVANGDVTDIVMNLYDDIELDAPINFYNKYFQVPVEYAITVNGNGHTISWADGYNGTLINVENGVSVTLKDLTIDGENAFTFYDDTTTVEDGQNWYTRFVDVGEEDKAINDNVIVNAGNLTLDSVCITGVTIASDGDNGKTANTETGGFYLMYNDDLALIKSNGGKVTINGGAIMYNAGMVLNAINAETSLNTNVMYNMGAGNKGGIIIANGGTMDIKGVITYNKAMARSATILGVINGAEVTFDAVMNYNEHIGVGSNTAGAMIVLEGASQFVMNGGTINYNEGGRAGAIASRWADKDTSIVLNDGSIIGNTASNNSWNGASIFLRSPATIGEGMTIDGTIAVNAAPGALEITGGTFNNFAMIVTDGLTAEITGGTFDNDPTEWVADSYATVYSDGFYTVKPVIAEIFFSNFLGGESSITYPGYADSLQELVDYYMFCNNANETAFPGFSFGDYTPVLVIYGELSAEDVAYLGGASTDGTYVSAKPMTWTVRFADGVDADENVKAAEGYVKVDNGDGTFTVQKAVAQVGDTYFATLQDAFAACTNGETITLLVDLVYDADDAVPAHGGATGFGNYDQYNPSIIYIGGTKGATDAENQPSNVNAVLDLNGHTITSNADAYMFLFMDNCKVTFMDSVGGGKVVNNSTNYPAIWSTGAETLVTIQSGTYQTASATGLIHATHSGDLVIEGGHFSTTADDASLLLMINSQKYNNPNYFLKGVATLTVKGGTFVGFNPEKVGDDYGATSTADIKFVNGCAEGYESIDNGDGTYSVIPTKLALVEVEIMPGFWGTSYITVENWADLVAALGANTNLPVKVTLLENIKLTDEVLTIAGATKKVIDLNGKRITGTFTEETTAFVYVTGGCELTILDSTVTEVDGFTAGGIHAINTNGNLSNLIRVETDGKLVIESGSYSQDASVNGAGMIDSRGDEIITIKGGHFRLYNIGSAENGSPWILNASSQNTKNIIVLGGTYNADIIHQYYPFEVMAPKELALVQGEDGIWHFVPAVAYVNEQEWSSDWYTNEVGYATLEDAIAAVEGIRTKNGKTSAEEFITLLADAVVTGNVDTKGITIEQNGFTIKLAAVDATLTAPEGLNVTTDVANRKVVYENGVYKLAVISYAAQIGDTKYETLQDAIDKAEPGDEIIVLENINIADQAIQTLGDKYNTLFLVEGKAVTVNLNGKIISGTYTGDSMLVGVFSTDNGGKLTLTGNGTIDVTADSTVYGLIVCYSADSSIVIENGTYKLDKASDSLIYTDGDENVTVKGGSFTLGNIGTGSNGSPWIFNAGGQNTKNIIVQGGTYNADIIHQYYPFEVMAPKELALVKGVGGIWYFVPAVAYVNEQEWSSKWYTNEVGYATLEEAIAAVEGIRTKNGKTSAEEFITLLGDVMVTGNVDTKGITIVQDRFAIRLGIADATLTAVEGLNVTTDLEGYKVVYEDGTYKVSQVVIAEIFFSAFGGSETSVTYPGYANSLQELVDYYMFCNNANETAIPGFSAGDYTPVLVIYGGLSAEDVAYLGGASTDGTYVSAKPMTWTVRFANGVDASNNIKAADGYVVLTNDDGTLTVTKILASITFEFLGETEYFTYPGYADGDVPIRSMNDLIDTYLIHAIDILGFRPGDPTITLHSDIALDETFLIDAQNPLGGEYDYDLTLDLNGYTITSSVTPAIRIVDDLDVTVKNGTMDTDSYCFILGASDGSSAGNLTIVDGTYHGGTSVASVTKGALTVLGGEFSVEPYEGSYDYTLNCIDANYKDGTASIVVKGGTFYKFNPENNASEGVGTNYVHAEYMAIADGDNYVVTEWNYEIWTKADLERLSAIVNGGNTLEGVTVKLMADIDLYEVDENGDRVTFAPIANNGSFNGIFEGNDHTISNLYQSGWALGYEWGSYGAIGLFGNINGATIRNLTIADAECFVEGGDVGAIAGSAEGDCTLEGITVKNSTFATYNNGCGGLIGWASAGYFTFKDIEVDEDTVIAGLWGSFDSSLGGILGQLDEDASAHFENVHVACRIDAYNDVTASYKWYSYRMCGMLIGRVLDVQQINGTNYPDPAAADVTIGENVVVTFGDWANYHYIWNDSLSKGCQRVEAGYAYDGIDITQYPGSTYSYIRFDALFGGPQSQRQGYYGLTEYPGVKVNIPAVAAIGETEYWTLQEALNAAKNSETVVLLKDLTYGDVDVVYPSGGATGFGKYDQYNPSIIYIGGTKGATEAENQPSNVNAVLDLNGHTITNNADAYLFLFMDNCKVTIKDSKDGDGIIGNTEAPVIWVTGTDTLVTIESGKYTTANAEGLLWSTHGGDLVIKGGEFSTSADDASLLIIRNAQDRRNPNYFIDGKATVTIYGGTFYGFDPEKMMDDSTNPFTEFNAVAEGYRSYEVEENVWIIISADSVVKLVNKITGVEFFDSIAAAMAKARLTDGDDVVYLLKNHEESVVLIYDGTTLDLQSYTLEADYLVSFNGGKITGAPCTGKGIGARLIVPKQFIALAENTAKGTNGNILIIWDKEENAFVFGDYGISLEGSEGQRGFHIRLNRKTGLYEMVVQFKVQGNGYINKNILADQDATGVVDQDTAGFHVEVIASWINNDNDVISQTYRFNNDMMLCTIIKVEGHKKVYDYVAGIAIDNHKDLTLTARIVTDAGLVISTETKSIHDLTMPE